jgi:hypothetical protein
MLRNTFVRINTVRTCFSYQGNYRRSYQAKTYRTGDNKPTGAGLHPSFLYIFLGRLQRRRMYLQNADFLS